MGDRLHVSAELHKHAGTDDKDTVTEAHDTKRFFRAYARSYHRKISTDSSSSSLFLRSSPNLLNLLDIDPIGR